jgi:holo-[acyl-carrier protein] synthase
VGGGVIHGIGTDIVAVARMEEFRQRHGEHGVEKLLAPEERIEYRDSKQPARLLAKRFAAKEAFGKALGTGVRAPATLPAIAVVHDALGKPSFAFAPELSDYLNERGLSAHLSITDERDYAVAFVILEKA